MSKRLIIAGAGGFGRGVYGWVLGSPTFLAKNEISEIAFTDDSETPNIGKVPNIGSIAEYYPGPSDLVLCAIGNPEIRRKVVDLLSNRGARFQTFVDDRAIVGPDVIINVGTIICPGVVISTGVRIHQHVHLNFNCSIGHDTEIGSFSTLSPAVNLMGELHIGESVFFGGSAAVLPRLRIGSNAVVAASALVTKNVPEDVLIRVFLGSGINRIAPKIELLFVIWN